MPEYLYEQPIVLTELSRQQFGQCIVLGLLNLLGIMWSRSALLPGGLLEVRMAEKSSRTSGSGSLIAIATFLLLKLLNVLHFYSRFYFVVPLCRLVIILIRNQYANTRNKRRLAFVRSEL